MLSVIISAQVPPKYKALIERLVEEERYMNKSDVIRSALRDLFKNENINEGSE